MNVYALIASLAWVPVGALFIWRLDRLANRWLTLKSVATEASEPVEIPDDLVGLAMQETEKWAQEQVLAVMRERWATFKDWNKVRSACGVAEVAQ